MRAWEKNIRKVTPYTPGEQPSGEGIIKLNTNENPYPPSPEAERCLKEADAASMRPYPDPEASGLVEAVSEMTSLDPGQVFVGVGSDDVLAMCFLTFFAGGEPILFPDITYSFYEVWARLFGVPKKSVPLGEDFSIRAGDYVCENGGIIFPNPNAPTGLETPREVIGEILGKNQRSIVIVDEAYVDFGAESALPLLKRYENLIVTGTLSKSRSMAGMRIGYACASPELIRRLKDVKYSFNSYTMSRIAIEAGAAAIRDEGYFERTRSKIIATRERVKGELVRLGFSFPDSKANFIFAAHRSVPARHIYKQMRERGIYLRYFDRPRIDNYIRITVGTDEQMDIFLEALKEVIWGYGG